jgi:hypothetical protein
MPTRNLARPTKNATVAPRMAVPPIDASFVIVLEVEYNQATTKALPVHPRGRIQGFGIAWCLNNLSQSKSNEGHLLALVAPGHA